MKPYFSIIIPVYNVAPYLRECLDSVLAQTFTDWEAICVDDGSTDGSGAILDEYAAKDKRFRVIHQKNAGVSSARNAALDVMKGAWVCFLDSDDMLHKSALKRIREIIVRNPGVDIVKTGLVQYKEDQIVSWLDHYGREELYNTSCDLPDSVLGGWFCQRCYNVSLVADIRFLPLRNGEDVVFMAQCNSRAMMIVVADCILYGYRQRKDSASRLGASLLLVRQIMGYTYQTLVEYDKSDKKVDPCYLRRICNAATEDLALYVDMLSEEEKTEAYGEVFVFWKRLNRLHIMPFVQKIRLHLVAIFTFRVISKCLFVLPRKLKEKGLHR